MKFILEDLKERKGPQALEAALLEAIRDPEPDEYNAASRLASRAKERQVLMLRFGTRGDAKTLAEIGRTLGVTRERVRQIEAKALRKLRIRRRWDILRSYMA